MPKSKPHKSQRRGISRRSKSSSLKGTLLPGVTLLALLTVVAWGAGALPAPPQPQQSPLAGFPAAASQSEQQWEQKFRAMPSPDNLRDYMKLLSAHPHHVGSPYDKQNAEWIAARFKEWGWDVHIESFSILFPTPKERLLEMTAPSHFLAKLQEPPLPGDPTSNQQSEQLPSYNAFSIDGDVTAPLVYVNYGVPDDYEQLARMGVSVEGAIVIARYGNSWRGIKPKVAAEHGAVGCLIYSDPRDDGYYQGEVFPNGAFRPPDGVQRGSVADLPIYPGDLLTPGVGATADARRLDLKDVKVFTKIPVLPISYGDAQPLLAALAGPVAPTAWRGALSITYHVGPGPATVHLKVQSNWDMKPVYDVIAQIAGASAPDEWVMRGNHHDAWVNGAQDPLSGLVAELEEARAFGELLKEGWKPKRTILYFAWDGEEPGLVGSTEWVETHADELRQHGVAYINSDSISRGYLNVGGSHSLQTFLNQVARDVSDPERSVSLWEREHSRLVANASGEERGRAAVKTFWPIEALGTGSDYTSFLDFTGVAAVNLGFGGESEGGIYHSIYDDFYWFTHFGDPSFVYGRALAQTSGTAVMRLADADLLPFNFSDLSTTVKDYVGEIEKLAETQANNVRERNREIAAGVFLSASDPTIKSVPPPAEPVPPHLDFAPLDAAVAALGRSADRYQHAFAHAEENNAALLAHVQGSPGLSQVNQELLHTERALIDPNGLPGRPWYKHQLYAPGLYTGYAVKTIPAVREAIEQKQWDVAARAIPSVAQVLQNEATAIDRAAGDLERAAP
jgi:N-acetylated-alpha-linked acidic dipeptidase